MEKFDGNFVGDFVEVRRGAGVLLKPIFGIMKFVMEAFVEVTGLGGKGIEVVEKRVLPEGERLCGVRAGVASIPARLQLEIGEWVQAVCDGQFSGQMADYVRKLLRSLGPEASVYEKFEAVFFEIFAVLYVASKPLIIVNPAFYLMPNLVYLLPLLNGLGFYAWTSDEKRRMALVLNSIAGVINRRIARGEKVEDLDSELRVLLLDFGAISDVGVMYRRLEKVLLELRR